MSKLIGILLFVLALWVGAEIYNEGVDGAFGGILGDEIERVTSEDSTPKRAANAFQRAYDRSEERVTDLLEKGGDEP
ncbi:MAG: hypothetical protein MJE66_23565 [Proteobacteria bacterium]|nr:hypothetical protein [Pseudomonadota bacterium]